MRRQVSGIGRLISASGGRRILEVAGRPMFELNPVAALIWEKLAAGLDTQDIINQIAEQFRVPNDQATRDVLSFIDELKRRLLICDDS